MTRTCFTFSWVLLVSGLFGGWANAQEKRFVIPQLSVVVQSEHAFVQEQIVQRIRLESNYPFNRMTVQIDDPVDAQVIELLPRTTRPFKTWGNEGWVFETTRALFAKKSGELNIPAIEISGQTEMPDGQPQPFSVSWPGQLVPISPPSDKLRAEPWIVATDVAMTEQWSTPPDLARAGELLTRTIALQAQGATGEHLPALSMPVSLGIAVLPGEIKRRTEVTKDSVVGHLTQSFAVRILTDTKADISPVQIGWFNSQTQGVQRASVRAYRVEPLPADVGTIVTEIVQRALKERDQSARTMAWLIAGVSLSIGLCTIGLLLVPSFRRLFRRALKRCAAYCFGPNVPLASIGIAPAESSDGSWVHRREQNER